MMPLMVAGAANTTLASLMLAAAIVIRAQTVIRLRAEECDARVAPSVVCRFIFKMPPNVGRNVGVHPPCCERLRQRSSVVRVNRLQWADDGVVKITAQPELD